MNVMLAEHLKNMRIEKSMSLETIHQTLGISPEMWRDWEAGKSQPSRRQLLTIIEKLRIYSDNYHYSAFMDYIVREDSSSNTHPSAPAAGTFATYYHLPQNGVGLHLQAQIEELQAEIEAINARSWEYDTVEVAEIRRELIREFQALQKKITQMYITSRDITAPVMFPSLADVQVRFISVISLERLNEYRSEETKWFTVSGSFIGAIFGVIINLIVGGQMQSTGWILILVFLMIAAAAAWSAYQYRQRAEQLSNQLLERTQPIRPTARVDKPEPEEPPAPYSPLISARQN